jgi:hypothetical protein
MKNRIVYVAMTAIVLSLGVSSFAASGGGSSHAGGAGSGGGQQAHGPDSKPGQGEQSAKAAKASFQQLADNKKLSSALAKLLPAGTDLQAASEGFKNLGQFVAAVHVSKNLGIPFADLKAKIMDGGSLGVAIKALRPQFDSDAEVKKAETQADKDAGETK